jgi:hypothetical protein
VAQWSTGNAAAHRTFTERLANRFPGLPAECLPRWASRDLI